MPVPEWTTPTTFTVGHIETADELNVVLRDNMNFLHAAKAVSVYRATPAQSISNNTSTAIVFNTETYDPWALHSTSTNPSRITIPDTLEGIWRFTGTVQFAANATGNRELYLAKNGTDIAKRARAALASGACTLDITTLTIMSENDYVELKVLQASGGNLDVDFGAELTALHGTFIGFTASA